MARSSRSKKRLLERPLFASSIIINTCLGQLGAPWARLLARLCAAPSFSEALGAVGAKVFQRFPRRSNCENAARSFLCRDTFRAPNSKNTKKGSMPNITTVVDHFIVAGAEAVLLAELGLRDFPKLDEQRLSHP